MSKKRIAVLLSAATAAAGYNTIGTNVASAQTTGTITVNCASGATGRKPISPLIYGQNYQFFNDPWLTGNTGLALDYDARFTWGITSRRFGGDASSRYNWRVGNAQNGGFNNSFVNGNAVYNGQATAKVWQHFLDENRLKGIDTTYSLPALGWVAKDSTSGTPLNGPFVGPYGNYYVPQNVPQTTTSVSSSTVDASDFIAAVKADPVSAGGRQAISTYIIDNEPDIWSSTHEDVAKGLNRTNLTQKGISAAEMIERAKEYSAVVRLKDPTALVAGPAVSGPGGMVFSGADKALWPRTDRGESTAGGYPTPEFTARGGVPFLKYYLQTLKAYDVANTKKTLDVVDVHFYAPYGGADGDTYAGGLYSQGTGPIVSAKRIESTQGLWKPGYKTDSAPGTPGEAEVSFNNIAGDIGDARILPRLNELVAPTTGAYPGLKTSLGEYNFGGAQFMSGALAQAEALGRFGENGLYSAYYWESSAAERNFPMERIPVGFAFRAYRNYDGAGSKFQDVSLPVTNPLQGSVSLFGSTSTTGDKVVMVALNLSPTATATPTITLSGCAAPATPPRYIATTHPRPPVD
jgi:Glycoside hydrolase family 44